MARPAGCGGTSVHPERSTSRLVLWMSRMVGRRPTGRSSVRTIEFGLRSSPSSCTDQMWSRLRTICRLERPLAVEGLRTATLAKLTVKRADGRRTPLSSRWQAATMPPQNSLPCVSVDQHVRTRPARLGTGAPSPRPRCRAGRPTGRAAAPRSSGRGLPLLVAAVPAAEGEGGGGGGLSHDDPAAGWIYCPPPVDRRRPGMVGRAPSSARCRWQWRRPGAVPERSTSVPGRVVSSS